VTVTLLPPAAAAFDAAATNFDARFGGWKSVAAQRAAVRRALRAAFPPRAHVLELGGGTGEDALWLASRGRDPLHTDPSPRMVAIARDKLRGLVTETPLVLAAEDLDEFAAERIVTGAPSLAGAYSNFAALNCVTDLRPVARALAALVDPGAPVLLVLFGTLPVGELVVQLARGQVRAAFRRCARGAVRARLGVHSFPIRYHRATAVRRAFQPWFTLQERRGIGVFVPPSAAEPWISRHPLLLGVLALLDRLVERPLAPFGDHVLYHFVRTTAGVQG